MYIINFNQTFIVLSGIQLRSIFSSTNPMLISEGEKKKEKEKKEGRNKLRTSFGICNGT